MIIVARREGGRNNKVE